MKSLSMLTAALALVLFSAASQATLIKATYTVNLNTVDPGLKVNYADVLPNPFSLNLVPGESVSGDLFKIWTDEVAINGDDKVSKPISVDFGFILPEIFGGSVNGTTVGGEICFFLCGEFGAVSWDNPADIYFGPKGDGHLKIWLSDETFNWGLFGTTPGEHLGATVRGRIKLIADATSVPEPGTLAMFGFGLLSLGMFLRKKRPGS